MWRPPPGVGSALNTVPLPILKVVGTSASGKSTLVACLRRLGYDARPVSQEHSEVPDLWQRFDKPYVLIFLQASLAAQRARRPGQQRDYSELVREQTRLANARDAADLRVDTSALDAKQVCEVVVTFLDKIGVKHADEPLAPVRATGSSKPTSP